MFIVKFLLVTADLLKCQGKVIKKIVFCKVAFFLDNLKFYVFCYRRPRLWVKWCLTPTNL